MMRGAELDDDGVDGWVGSAALHQIGVTEQGHGAVAGHLTQPRLGTVSFAAC